MLKDPRGRCVPFLNGGLHGAAWGAGINVAAYLAAQLQKREWPSFGGMYKNQIISIPFPCDLNLTFLEINIQGHVNLVPRT